MSPTVSLQQAPRGNAGSQQESGTRSSLIVGNPRADVGWQLRMVGLVLLAGGIIYFGTIAFVRLSSRVMAGATLPVASAVEEELEGINECGEDAADPTTRRKRAGARSA